MSRLLFLIALLVAACGGSTSEETGSDGGSTTTSGGTPFIAMQKDFAGFTGWTSFQVDGGEGDGVPSTEPRTVYLNSTPPHGSTAFPNGTILVKSLGWGSADAGVTFAMVKRGGGFNAVEDGWEWFELAPGAGGEPLIVWRGVQAPAGDAYSNTGVTCNACHAAAKSNDFVPSAELDLSRF